MYICLFVDSFIVPLCHALPLSYGLCYTGIVKSSFLSIGRALVALLVFLFLVPSRPAIAQGDVFCSVSFGPCSQSSLNCDQGYVPPCQSGDCCLEYYLQNSTCPFTLPCILPPQNTPTPQPSPVQTPGPQNCAGPFGTYCGPGMPCRADQTCNTSNPVGVPAPCFGICVSATVQPTQPPGGPPGAVVGGKLEEVCDFVPENTPQRNDCVNCFSQGKSWTAIGCISTNPTGSDGFITTLLRFGTGIAGGIAFFLILLGGFQILTSAGNPERLHAGQELVGSAVGGLLLIIFSLFLLRLIGFTILKIPGFG